MCIKTKTLELTWGGVGQREGKKRLFLFIKYSTRKGVPDTAKILMVMTVCWTLGRTCFIPLYFLPSLPQSLDSAVKCF